MTYETVSDSERAYFDTSMWTAILLHNVSQADLGFVYDKFRELKRGTFHVYASDMVLMECSWAIRRRIAERKESASMSPDDLQREIDAKVAQFYEQIVQAQNAGMITVENPTDSLDHFLQRSHDLSRRPQKRTLHYREKRKQYQYIGAGFLDFQHAIIAARLGCSRVYTLDRGFNIFSSIPEFRTLTIITPQYRIPENGARF